MTLYDQFVADAQGRKFTDVLNDSRLDFRKTCDFFEDKDCQRRMLESETHHNRPALAGVVKEFESQPEIGQFFDKHDGHTTTRFRQAVGVLVRIVMENNNWRTTGRKGSLGTRATVAARTRIPGVYRNNTGSLSIWFTRAERYES